MSKENAKRFQDELNKNESLQKELKDYNSSSFEDLVSFAGEKGFIFTVDEFKEIQLVTEKGTEPLSDDELAKVAGGKGQYEFIVPGGGFRFICERVAGNDLFVHHVLLGQNCMDYESLVDQSRRGSCLEHCKYLSIEKLS